MIFEKKSEKIHFVKYTKDRKTLIRRISFKRQLAEETNKIITVFNNESEAVKLNSSILTAIAFNCLLKHLENLTDEKTLEFLEKEALKESKK